MKKNYVVLLIALISFSTYAQDVNIPDDTFLQALIDAGVDANSDGIIQVSEAQATTNLTLFVSGVNITGLEAFVNLTSLTVTNASFSGDAIDLTMMPNLEHIDFNNTFVGTIDVTGLTNLKYISVHDGSVNNLNPIASAAVLEHLDLYYCNAQSFGDFSAYTNLKYLNCSHTYPGPVNVSGMTQLEYLDCSARWVNSLDLTGLNNLQTLICDDNQLSVLDLTGLTNLRVLKCNNTQLSSLDVSGQTLLEILDCGSNLITSLDVAPLTNLTSLTCNMNQLTSLAVGGLTQLEKLECNDNNISSLNLSPLFNLEILAVGSNPLGAIDVSTLVNLKDLTCDNAGLTSLDVTNSPLLEFLSFGSNNLTSIDLSGNPGLKRLIFPYNNLSTLDLTANPLLTIVMCGHNQLTSIDLSNSINLRSFAGFDNLFTTLDFSACVAENWTSAIYDFYNNPALTYVNLKNGAMNDIYVPIGGEFNCPNLAYICADDFEIPYIVSSLGDPNVQVNSYCSFTPGGLHNTIIGHLSFDHDNDGCGAGDSSFPGLKINISDGINTGSTFTTSGGNYAFFTQSGDFTVTPVMENPYFTVTPPSATVNFATLDESTQTRNFCIVPNGIHKDVEISIAPTTPARPGFDANYILTYINNGNQTLSGTVTLGFQDDVLDLVSSNPVATAQPTGVISWDYANLEPFETRHIIFTMNVNSPLESPAVNIDDILHYAVSILPILDDEAPNDNTEIFDQIVVGSFDPNDKTCIEGSRMTPQMVGEYLHYLIRFQNSGTFYAENVVVTDVIDTSKFDLSTFQLTASSHPQVTRITGNKVEFIFEGINLPAEQDDEPGSHGYVAFKIKTKPTLMLDDVVENTADIFFDFNAPITTNTTSTTVSLLGLNEVSNVNVSIAPNPVKNVLDISSRENMTSVQVFDIQGRLLQTSMLNDTATTIDFTSKTTGVYFIKVTTDSGTKVQKIIKQ